MKAQSSIGRGDRLPPVLLPSINGRDPVDLRSTRRSATVVVTMHANCSPCADYLERLLLRDRDIRDWGGRVIAALNGVVSDDDAPLPIADLLHGVTDPAGRLRRAGVPTPAVVIADPWGEVHEAEAAGAQHAFMAVDEVTSWIRYLAIQCPECQGEAL